MRKIKFDETFINNLREYACEHTVAEISNRFTLKQDTVRRLLYEYNIRPVPAAKNSCPNPIYVYDDVPADRISLVCNLYTNTDMSMRDICIESHLHDYIVQGIIIHNFSQSYRDARKAKLYRASKLADKNPMYQNYKEKHPRYCGEVISTGTGYLQTLKPDWYTGRKNSKYVFHHNVVVCQALGLTEIPKGFCVHHIDYNKQNNDISNLALMSLSAHMRLHHFETKLQGAETIHKGVGETPNAEQ